MRRMQKVQLSLVVLATIGMLLPSWSFADTTTTANIQIRDIALHEDGRLVGQVVDSDGQGVGDTAIAIVNNGKVVAATKSDLQGRYTIAGLKGGVHHLITEKGITVCRLWADAAAPPSAGAEAMIVHSDQVVRGGMGDGSLVNFLSNPAVLAILTAAAIAVPLAIDDSKDGS